ncbi:MAG TPA: ABC transporter ATP-binding protein [Rhodopila sp.]|uniref:ABC transporter ATP-binding protein n=1 Tax=Rhodopila sp. TaxID=2480087 RepID=UPI002B52AC95|nr:ABC transporter ATP-binding protein [Rhodopila sp.]HVY17607.1 ABC transporter ATP-binding protein [Rhodopila sp.]
MDAMTDTALVEARGLTKHFQSGGATVRAVDGLDFRIDRGETVGLLGESGSGKTTTGRLLLRLTPPSAGEIRFGGADVATMSGPALKRFRTRAQLVFQNPFDALNPRFTMRQSLAEPLINAGVPRSERAERMDAVLRQVHLPDAAGVLANYPHQMSGGQLQRVVLARALILRPDFIVADEPVSMLDVSVRAGILNLMRDVRDEMGLAAIYISHDVTLVRYVCVRTLVMYRGRIVEDGPTEDVVRHPRHPYTQALIAAVPVPRVEQNRAAIPLKPARHGSGDLAVGCGFRDRCPYAFERCFAEKPELRPAGAGHLAACHLDP